MPVERLRCWKGVDPLHIAYHDEEWGVPLHDDNKLFEFLVLGGFQAGLTWHQILSKRQAFRMAFDTFDPKKVALYTEVEIERIFNNGSLIRNKQKIAAAVNNAKAFIIIQKDFGSFDAYIWKFVDDKPINNNFKYYSDAPAKTTISETLSLDLRKRGFKFVGPIICYAFMQAVGMVNDHGTTCFRHDEIMNLTNEKDEHLT